MGSEMCIRDSQQFYHLVHGWDHLRYRCGSGTQHQRQYLYQLTVSSAWGTPPDSSSFYVITRKKAFTRTSPSDNVLRYTAGGSVNQPLANLITSHTFSQPDANTINITLTAQTMNGAPNTQQKRQYTLTETVLRRN